MRESATEVFSGVGKIFCTLKKKELQEWISKLGWPNTWCS